MSKYRQNYTPERQESVGQKTLAAAAFVLFIAVLLFLG